MAALYIAAGLVLTVLAVAVERWRQGGPSPARIAARAWLWLRLGRAERRVRKLMRVPAYHPERIIRALPGTHDDRLDELATELWPEDEFVDIIRETGSGS